MFAKPSRFRIRAFLWHLLCSLLMAIVSATIVFCVWHPSPLEKAVGVGHIFLMMLAIDVVLGPILTFTVAKEGKELRKLKWDLSIIVLIQLGALIYGLHSIAVSRPVFLVFDVWRFEIVQANDVPKNLLEQAASPYNHLPWTRPEWVVVRPAANSEERNNRLFGQLSNGISPAMQPELYAPLEQHWDMLIKEGQPLAQLKTFNTPEIVDSTLTQYPDANRFLPMKASRQDMTVLINTETKKIVGIVDLRPWK